MRTISAIISPLCNRACRILNPCIVSEYRGYLTEREWESTGLNTLKKKSELTLNVTVSKEIYTIYRTNQSL